MSGRFLSLVLFVGLAGAVAALVPQIGALHLPGDKGLVALLRQAGYTVFTIGLGNPDAQYEGDVPDEDFLERLANVAGMVSSQEPMGEMLFAPTPDDLDAAFAKLADRILTRLTR